MKKELGFGSLVAHWLIFVSAFLFFLALPSA